MNEKQRVSKESLRINVNSQNNTPRQMDHIKSNKSPVTNLNNSGITCLHFNNIISKYHYF
jgi:hypothetical protein